VEEDEEGDEEADDEEGDEGRGVWVAGESDVRGLVEVDGRGGSMVVEASIISRSYSSAMRACAASSSSAAEIVSRGVSGTWLCSSMRSPSASS